MGLDMFLYKAEKVPGFTINQYIQDDNERNDNDESCFKEVAYWRKANAIHGWFVKNVQGGNDDCSTYPVTEDQLKQLLDTINQVLADHNKAQELLPAKSGFFFGSTDYGQYYYDDLVSTQEILNRVINEIDFDKEVLFYDSWW